MWAVRRALRADAAGAGADLRGDVRPGGVAGVVVAPLGVGAADGAGDDGRGGGTGSGMPRLAAVSCAGLALMVWTPITLMPEHQETTASLWRQLAGASYLWWALAVIVVAGTVRARAPRRRPSTAVPAVDAVQRLASRSLGKPGRRLHGRLDLFPL